MAAAEVGTRGGRCGYLYDGGRRNGGNGSASQRRPRTLYPPEAAAQRTEEFREKTKALRKRFSGVVRRQFGTEIDRPVVERNSRGDSSPTPGFARGEHDRSLFCSSRDDRGDRVLSRRDRGARRQLVLTLSLIRAWLMTHIRGAGEVSPLR